MPKNYRKIVIDENTFFDEQAYITKKHYFESGGNTDHIITLLARDDIELTAKTRLFIASVLVKHAAPIRTKKQKDHLFPGNYLVKPAKHSGKVSKYYFRHLNIYWDIEDLRQEGNRLTSNSKNDGVDCKVAAKWHETEFNVSQINTRMKPKEPELDDFL